MVSSLIRFFISQRGDWKMIKQSGLKAKLQAVNIDCQLALTLYFHSDPIHSTVYNIIGP